MTPAPHNRFSGNNRVTSFVGLFPQKICYGVGYAGSQLNDRKNMDASVFWATGRKRRIFFPFYWRPGGAEKKKLYGQGHSHFSNSCKNGVLTLASLPFFLLSPLSGFLDPWFLIKLYFVFTNFIIQKPRIPRKWKKKGRDPGYVLCGQLKNEILKMGFLAFFQ